jgi:hypothetical protein
MRRVLCQGTAGVGHGHAIPILRNKSLSFPTYVHSRLSPTKSARRRTQLQPVLHQMNVLTTGRQRTKFRRHLPASRCSSSVKPVG